MGSAYCDVFYSKNVSDSVIEVEGFVGGFVGVLSALYCSLDNR